jgi:hypothetical protein
MRFDQPERLNLPRIGCLVALALLAGVALMLVLHGNLNADEGFYLLVSRFVAEGLHPYRDFGYTQGPVLPYVNVPWLHLFGFSLAGQRLTNLAWTAIAVGLGVVVLRRRHGWAASAVFAVLLLSAPVWLGFATKGKTYAFGALMVLIGAIVMKTPRPTVVQWSVFIAAAALGTGARFPLAAFFLPAGLWMLRNTLGWRNRLIAMFATAGSAGLLLLWAGHGAWESFEFWTMKFHQTAAFKLSFTSHFLDCALFSPVLWLLVPTTFFVVRDPGRRPVLAVLCSLLTGIVLNLTNAFAYAEYVLPFFPALAWAVAPTTAALAIRVKPIVVGCLVAVALSSGWIRPPELNRDILVHAGKAETFLRTHLRAGEAVVGSMPEIPAATGHPVPPLLAMGKFGLTEDFSPEQAARLKMLSPASLLELIEDKRTGALVFATPRNWNFYWSLPSYKPMSDSERRKLREAIERDYELRFTSGHYVILLRRPRSQP